MTGPPASGEAPTARSATTDERPTVRSAALQAVFEAEARRQGFDPQDPWVTGYVDYEWRRLRHVLRARGLPRPGDLAFEFGCNVGASAIVLGTLGAHVTALDVDPKALAVARVNAARHGIDTIRFVDAAPATPLPFADGAFDLVVCNSVLEYVPHEDLPAVVAELTRVLRDGGHLLIVGTSSRLWPREMHSGRWFTNWLPRVVDRVTGVAQPRGVGPWRLRRLLGPGWRDLDAEDAGAAWLQARRDFGDGRVPRIARMLTTVTRLARIGPGWLTPSLSALLVKRD